MTALPVEQENYVRLSLLLTGVSPKAVRTLFDREFAPTCLTASIRKEYKKIRNLFCEKHIKKEQFKLLQGNQLESTSFDISLMICLLRNLTNIQGPKTGYDVLPQPSDQCVGADLARLKYYRNVIAHLTDDKIYNDYFNTAADDICGAIERLGGSSLTIECNKLKHGPLDQSNIEILKEVRISMIELSEAREDIKDLKEEIGELTEQTNGARETPNNLYSHLPIEDEYQNKVFLDTESSRKILNAITYHQCVIITGPPGCGKLTNALNTAILLHSQPESSVCHIYRRANINELCSFGMLSFYRNVYDLSDSVTSYDIYVLDGFFGKCSFNERNFISWRKQLIDISLKLRTKDIKLVLTCRSDLYKNHIKGNLGIPVHECQVLYDGTDIQQICTSVLKSEVHHTLPKDPTLLALMPALCSLQDCELFLKDIDKIGSVAQLIEIVIQRIKNRSMWGYRAFVLLCIMNNHVEKSIFRKATHSHDTLLRKLFLETGDRVSSIKEKIEHALSSCTFIEETKTEYTCMQEWIFDYGAVFMGKENIDMVLDCSDSSFIREKILLETNSSGKKEDDLIIKICSDEKEVYQMRTLRDLNNGYLWNVISSCHGRLSDLQIVLEWFQNNGKNAKDISDNSTGLYIATFFGCMDLVKVLIKVDRSQINSGTSEKTTPLYCACSLGYTKIVKLLIEQDASIESDSLASAMPFIIACANQHYDIVSLLLKYMNIKDWYCGMSPLHIACENGNKEIAKILVSHNAKVNKDIDDIRPLHIAAFRGHKDIIQILLSYNASVNFASKAKDTPLCMAACNGHTEAVDILLKHYATVNTFNEGNMSPVYAASKNGHADIVELLLFHKATVKNKDNYKTALGIACSKLHANVIAVLLKYDTDTNNCDDIDNYFDCSPALHLVCKSRTEKDKKTIIQILLEKSVDINMLDRQGYTPLDYSLDNSDFEISELLIDKGGTVNHTKSLGQFPLSVAAERGFKTLVAFLLKNVTNIDDLKNQTAFDALISFNEVAANYSFLFGRYCQNDMEIQNFIKIIKLVLSKHVDVNQCNRYGYSPLTLACAVGNVFCIPILLDHGVNVNTLDENGKTPLFTACDRTRVDVVSCLLEYDVDINQQCSDGSTALHAIISYINRHGMGGDARNILNNLLKSGASPDLVDKDKKSVLHISCETDDRIVVAMLLDNNPDLSLKMINGFTPLHIACKKGLIDVVACLLTYLTDTHKVRNLEIPDSTPKRPKGNLDNESTSQVDAQSLIDEPDVEGKTSLHIACSNGYSDVVEILLRSGAFIDKQDNNNCTPLYLACEMDHQKTAELLIQSNANINMGNYKGWTPLHIVCRNGHTNGIEILLRSGAFIDKQDNNNCTPLYLACKKNHQKVAELLIQSNANINLASCKGWTPLHIVCRNGHTNVVHILLQNGADKLIKDINGLIALKLAFSRNIKDLLLCTCAMLDRTDRRYMFSHEHHCMSNSKTHDIT